MIFSAFYGSPGAQALFRKSSNAAYERPVEIGEGSDVLPFSRTSAACSPCAVPLGHPAEREQRPIDGAGGSVHEHWLASFYLGGVVKQLVSSHPT